MQDLDRNLEQDKKLARRSWQGPLLALTITLVIVFAAIGLMFLLMQTSYNTDTARTSRLLVGVILGIVLLLILGGGGLALLLYLMRWSMEREKQNFVRGTEVLRRTLPQLVSEPEVKAAQDFFSGKAFAKLLLSLLVYLIVASVLILAIHSGIQYFWPDAPRWVSTAIRAVLILGAALIIGRLAAKRREKQGGEQTLSLKAALLRMFSALLFFAFTMLPLLGLFQLVKQIHVLAGVPFVLIVLPLGFGLLSMIYLLLPFLWVLAALKQADYETAIRRSQGIEQFHAFRGTFLNLHGFALFLAGRYDKAQQLLHESIRAARRELASGGANGLDNIGCVLAAQGQYDEAIRMFEGAIEISPQQVGAYNDLAQVYLTQAIEPERVLELTERALKNYRASFWARWLERFNFASIHANRAWALALLDRCSEAAQALEQAFAGADRSFVPEFAGVHYRAGQSELLCGNRTKAAEHWRQAQQLDPHGHYGRLAAQALHNLEA